MSNWFKEAIATLIVYGAAILIVGLMILSAMAELGFRWGCGP